MTIIQKGSKYFIEAENGFQEIPYLLAMDLFESGEVTHWEELSHD